MCAGWILPPAYGFMAAGLGSALADLFSGYVIYAPATFMIKGIMTLTAFYVFQILHKKLDNLYSRIISGTIAEIVMILGYFIFESFLYGFISATINIPINGVQGILGLVIAVILMKFFEKSKISLK